MQFPMPGTRAIDSWQAAERNAADWMRHWGFSDAQVTAAGSDGGVDVWAKDALAQVKYEAHFVGRPALQRLVGAGALEGKQLLFFTGSGYASPAVAYGDQMNIGLFKYALDGGMLPINGVARTIASSPREVEDRTALARAEHARVTRDYGPPDPEKKEPQPGAVKLMVGLLMLVWFCLSLTNEDNYDAADDIWAILVVGGGSLLAGVLLVRSGIRQLRQSRGS